MDNSSYIEHLIDLVLNNEFIEAAYRPGIGAYVLIDDRLASKHAIVHENMDGALSIVAEFSSANAAFEAWDRLLVNRFGYVLDKRDLLSINDWNC